MAAKITWKQALAWRMRRQLLEPIGSVAPEEVVRRLGGVQAQVASTAELAIRLRQRRSRSGEVGRALAAGRLVKTWAMRGTLHLLTPEDAGAYLSLMAAGRSWETPSWQRYFGMTDHTWDLLRGAVRDALAGGAVLTRDELGAAVTSRRGLEHIGDELKSGWGTLLKPLAWQGDLCFGASRGARVTFAAPSTVSAGWAGVPNPDEAAPIAIGSYLGAYGPASAEAFSNWLSRGRISKRQVRAWFAALAHDLAEVEVEGEPLLVRAEDIDGLAASKPTRAVRLLAGFDAWVLGPGTEDAHVIPSGRRWDVSRQSGWIAPAVVKGGVVTGTWKLERGRVTIEWFAEAGRPPTTALRAEVERLASIVGVALDLEIASA